MKKDKKPSEEMRDKKRLHGLVWDGLFNSLEDKLLENKNSTAPKKGKKDKKADDDKDDPEDKQNAE